MARVLQLRRGTTAENDLFTGAVGELTMDTTTNELRVHDGTTVGGYIIGSNKVDLDLDNMNPSATSKQTIVGWSFPDLTTGVSVSTSGFTSTKKQWLCIRAGASNNYFNVNVNGLAIYTIYSDRYGTNTSCWYPLDVGDVVTYSGTYAYFDCATYDMKGL